MILLAVTKEARGSSGWQPKQKFYFCVSDGDQDLTG